MVVVVKEAVMGAVMEVETGWWRRGGRWWR